MAQASRRSSFALELLFTGKCDVTDQAGRGGQAHDLDWRGRTADRSAAREGADHAHAGDVPPQHDRRAAHHRAACRQERQSPGSKPPSSPIPVLSSVLNAHRFLDMDAEGTEGTARWRARGRARRHRSGDLHAGESPTGSRASSSPAWPAPPKSMPFTSSSSICARSSIATSRTSARSKRRRFRTDMPTREAGLRADHRAAGRSRDSHVRSRAKKQTEYSSSKAAPRIGPGGLSRPAR
jgi:hypothetical protein